ncbi:DUF1015 domain-containing protein [Streptomyces zagrosensis]|uniref:Uncharacterized protein (DUF1015 family) n=1 Tax=Streptomyces zagrosensis TaxID=1042984 RepID=A0A7W9QDZ7_9ACTN|nr:DUF1015 domain-containing protein [Streptomyces zagrosensis]MBB5937482.1 uncharacterized protein (DUF1015 family) [Streptomyces zagrosensis]
MSTPGPGRQGLQLVPFRGLRYAPERVSSLAAVTSPPYDVVVRPDGLRHLETADPYNIVRLILPQTASPTARHQQAAQTLRRWQAEGVLAPDPEPALYVYEQRDEGLLQRGVIGALRLSPPEEGIVLPHENVMPHIVEDRADLMRATAANLEPLLLSYHGGDLAAPAAQGTSAVIDRTVLCPPLLATTTEDGVAHRLWRLCEPADIAEVTTDLAQHQALIADGHHRWATYLRLRAEQRDPSPWDFGLVLLIDSSRYPLRVRAIHRLLRQLPIEEALTAVGDVFRVRPVDGPLPRALEALAEAQTKAVQAGDPPNAFLLAGNGGFHLLDHPDRAVLDAAVPSDRPEAWRTLDATVLHALLIGHIWQVPDAPEYIGYIHDATAAVEQTERHGGTAVLMCPVEENVVRDLARQGVAMPHKSTSFGPKPATGLVLRSLELD